MTDDDARILHRLGPGLRYFYGRADRIDAEQAFARVDSQVSATPGSDNAKKKENLPHRGD